MYIFALKAQYLKMSIEVMVKCKKELLLKMGTPSSLS